MLHLIPLGLIPAPLHRVLLRIAHALRKHWWRLRRPRLESVCVAAGGPDGALLLLRQFYGTRDWVLPGGGVDAGESALEAARREFEEEAGCAVRGLSLALVSEERLHGSRNRVHIFTGRAIGIPRPDGREIVAARFFPPAALPPDIHGPVLRRLRMAGIL